jgi:hypothetical protein
MMGLKARWEQIIQQPGAVAGLVFVISLLIYSRTVLPGLVGGDAGEPQYAAPLLVLGHPTGQPLYFLIGFVWSHLVPVGTIAFRMNLLTMISAAGGNAVAGWALARLTRSGLIGLVSGLTFGLGMTQWGQSALADKYGFLVLLAMLVGGLALVWNAEHDQPHGDRLLLALSLAYGISLLHHRSMIMFAPGLGIMAVMIKRRDLITNWRLIALCVGLVLLPSLIVYPLFLGFVRARGNSPLLWQPTDVLDWINWWFERHIVTGKFLVFDSVENVLNQFKLYGETLLRDFTLPGVVLAGIGLVWLMRRRLPTGVFLLLTFILVGVPAANFRGHIRLFIYYLPSFTLVALMLGIGLQVAWQTLEQKMSRAQRWLPALSLLLLAMPVYQFMTFYPVLRREAVYGDPLDAYRQTLKSGTMADRLVAGLADLPPDAVLISDWEQITPLWTAQKIYGLRPDVTLRYPIGAMDEYKDSDRPLCLARSLPVGPEWHPSSAGPLVCLNRQPVFEVRPDLASLSVILYSADNVPQIELAGARIGEGPFAAGQYVPLLLAWRGQGGLGDWSISIHILDPDMQQVFAADINAPVLGMYPTSHWAMNEVVHDYHELAIPPEMPPAQYLWTVVVYRQIEDGSFQQLRDSEGNVEIIGGSFEVVPK